MGMRKKRIVLFRRLLVAAVFAAVLVVLLFGGRAVFGAVRGLLSKGAAAPGEPRYNGEPVSVKEYINDDLDRPAVDWNLMLVSEQYPLAEGYVPVLATVRTRWQVDERIEIGRAHV